MSIKKNNVINQALIKIVFLIIPTLLLSYFLLLYANSYYSILNNQTSKHVVYLGLGMILGTIFFSTRLRFVPILLILISILFLLYKGIDQWSFGEFDAFFNSIKFSLFAFLFSSGFIIGYGFSRFKYFSILISCFFLSICILLITKQSELFLVIDKETTFVDYGLIIGPLVLYAVYILFSANLIHSYQHQNKKIWTALLSRLSLFLALTGLLFIGILWFQQEKIEDILSQLLGDGEMGNNSMLKKNEDNTFDLEEYSKLRGNLGRSNELLFAAHIDHFFPNTDVPNPLYLTAFYYSRFDTLTETFEKDTLIPDNDLFLPELANIPLFSIKEDSSVLQTALKEQFKETVEIEVYKKQLSHSSFIAPSTSFFVQPITIEKDFQSEFHAAYRAKSYVSSLNSAYFVYNIDDPQAKVFQEQRFEILRSMTNYDGVSQEIMDYYTDMPDGHQFNRIKDLADSLTNQHQLPIDKVLSIRDYFLQKDENGKQVFQYSDNPGVPDIPSASKLSYFLFENRKGYCAYYAGATLFLLRAAGIPSRITAGFMTVERSSKNKGWYWFYADQAHAWVQIYFPGFGWLDFDTTVGNEDAIESPTPDGTPPLQPPKAYLVMDGIVQNTDSSIKNMDIILNRLLFKDEERQLTDTLLSTIDASLAVIKKDSVHIPFTDILVGDSITAVSYAISYRSIPKIKEGESVSQLLKRLPDPNQIDEIYIKNKKEELQPEFQKAGNEPEPFSFKKLIYTICLAILLLLLLFIFSPSLLWQYYKMRANKATSIPKKSYWTYRAILFYLNQLGFHPGSKTILLFSVDIDNKFSTDLKSFINAYLKLKYGKGGLNEQEASMIRNFLPEFINQIKEQIPASERRKDFFKIKRLFEH